MIIVSQTSCKSLDICHGNIPCEFYTLHRGASKCTTITNLQLELDSLKMVLNRPVYS